MSRPAVRPIRHGFCVAPVSGFSPTAVHPCSVIVVFPTMMAPAARSLATATESAAAGDGSDNREPRRVGRPATA